MTRKEFQQLARVRLEEAKSLLSTGHFAGAYYLAGYVVECGLKACIAKKTKRFDFPPDRKTVEKVYSHDFDSLVSAAKLVEELGKACKADKEFEDFWKLANDWSEASRYEESAEQDARKLLQAITDRKHGVLRWIRGFW